MATGTTFAVAVTVTWYSCPPQPDFDRLSCVPSVWIPRSSPSRKEKTYATLVHHVREFAPFFEGRLISCGKRIDECELWPDDSWPPVPLLIEHSGADYSVDLKRRDSGFGGRIRPRIYILWRYDRENGWRELARTSTVDSDWVESFRALIEVELRRNPLRVSPVELAVRSFHRCVELLDGELGALPNREARALTLSYLHEEITARVAALDSAA